MHMKDQGSSPGGRFLLPKGSGAFPAIGLDRLPPVRAGRTFRLRNAVPINAELDLDTDLCSGMTEGLRSHQTQVLEATPKQSTSGRLPSPWLAVICTVSDSKEGQEYHAHNVSSENEM